MYRTPLWRLKSIKICSCGRVGDGTFFRIVVPLAAPATILAAVLVFMGGWSDYLLSLVMINSQSSFTIQLREAQFLSIYGVEHMPQYPAAVIVATLPAAILYILGYRWILRGTLAGALKG